MTLGTESDRFIRSLAEENAQLRAMLQKQADVNLPPSPPASATEGASSRSMSPIEAPDPLLRRPSQAREDEDVSPLRTIIELLRVQIASQSNAQDRLLDQLGELRSSYATLQAATSDVTDELVVMREKSARLVAEVDAERRERRKMEEEKAAEAEKVLTLRSKVEESRRAIMRLQDEAATRRASDSRRGSAAGLLGTPLGGERRGSLGPASSVIGGDNSRRNSLAVGSSSNRRNSTAICDSPNGVGLGLDLAGQPPIAADSLSRRASLAHVAVSSPLASTPRRAHSVSAAHSGSHATGRSESVEDRLATVRRSVSDAQERRRSSLSTSSLAAVREDGDAQLTSRRVGSLRASTGRLSLPAARRHSSLATTTSNAGGNSSRTSLAEDEAAAIRAQLQALQRRLGDIEASSGPPRKLNEYVMATESPQTPGQGGGSRRPSAQMAQFGTFSFQIQGRNPALLDTPPSPSGGTFSPGGTRRATNEQLGPFAHQAEPMPKSSLSQETIVTTPTAENETRVAKEEKKEEEPTGA